MATNSTLIPVTISGWYEHTDGTVGEYKWRNGSPMIMRTVANWANVPDRAYSVDDRASRVAPLTLSDSADVYLPDAHPRRFFPARLNLADRWNGWAQPYFEQDEARRMLASMVADKVISAFSETTEGCFVTYEIDDDAKEYPQTCHPELVKVDDGHEWSAVSLWPIGAGSWTWLEQDRA